jgi:hypothetical protein
MIVINHSALVIAINPGALVTNLMPCIKYGHNANMFLGDSQVSGCSAVMQV